MSESILILFSSIGIVWLIVHWVVSERRLKNTVICPRCYRSVKRSCGPNCAWDWEDIE